MPTSILANRKMPNSNGWQDRHDAAVHNGAISHAYKEFETPLVLMLKGWAKYAEDHRVRFESKIGDDGVLGPEWEAIRDALRGLLNGELGRLDGGTLDGFLLNTMRDNGIDTDQK